MSEFIPRAEPVVAIANTTDRHVPILRVPKVERADATAADPSADPQVTERSMVEASYARIKERIASVLAGLNPPRAPVAQAVDAAEQALGALMPEPVIVIPMPPADPDMIAFVAQVAQSMAERTAHARAAQGGLRHATVEAALL